MQTDWTTPTAPIRDRLPGHLLRQFFCVVVVQDVWLVLSHLLGELWAGRGVPGWSALGFWLSVVVMVAVAGVLDVSFKRRNWLSRLLDVAEQEVDSAGR